MSARRDADYARIPHEMYRVYDAADRLLYVGMGRRADERIRQHIDFLNSQVQGSHLMAGLMASYFVERLPSRAAARDAERAAIAAERPFFNKHHNKNWQLMRDEYFVIYGGSEEIGRLEREASMLAYQANAIPKRVLVQPEPFVRDRADEVRQSLAFIDKYELHAGGVHPFASYVAPTDGDFLEALNGIFSRRSA